MILGEDELSISHRIGGKPIDGLSKNILKTN